MSVSSLEEMVPLPREVRDICEADFDKNGIDGKISQLISDRANANGNLPEICHSGLNNTKYRSAQKS